MFLLSDRLLDKMTDTAFVFCKKRLGEPFCRYLKNGLDKPFFGHLKDYGLIIPSSPAAADTIERFLRDYEAKASDFDVIYTGDLGKIGSKLLYELLLRKGIDIEPVHKDCGVMIYGNEDVDVHAGGSGCGCCASVLCGHILNRMLKRKEKNILFVATGALLSPTTTLQGETIPSIAHLVNIRI